MKFRSLFFLCLSIQATSYAAEANTADQYDIALRGGARGGEREGNREGGHAQNFSQGFQHHDMNRNFNDQRFNQSHYGNYKGYQDAYRVGAERGATYSGANVYPVYPSSNVYYQQYPNYPTTTPSQYPTNSGQYQQPLNQPY